MIKRKRIIIIGVAALLMVCTGGFFTYKWVKSSADKKLEQKKESVQTAIQEEENSCSQDNLTSLEDVYNGTSKTEDKALFAEQLGTCYGVNQDNEKAATWYQFASDHYQELGDKDRTESLKQAAEASRALVNTPQIIEPEGANMDEGLGQN